MKNITNKILGIKSPRGIKKFNINKIREIVPPRGMKNIKIKYNK